MRRTLLGIVAVACLVVGLALGSWMQGRAAARPTAAKKVVHVVLFKVKDGVSKADARRLIDDAHRLLKKIPVVKELHVGYRAPGDRPVHIQDYDIGLYILFDRFEDVETYLKHPLHVQYAERAHEVTESVRVADFYSE